MSLQSRLLRTGLMTLSAIFLFCSIPCDDAAAQLRRGADRGRGGILGGRLEQRLNRIAPALVPNAVNPNAAGNRGPVPAPRPGGAAPGATPSTANGTAARSANYVSPAAAPPNRLPYAGPGVIVRLPADLPGEVNYLIDGTEHLVIHPGEEQPLRLKGSYDVRFSRGVTEDGREFGEAHYTITEGVYRFAVTDRGWELYRDPDSTLALGPSNSLQLTAPQLSPSQLTPSQPSPEAEETLPAPHPRSILER